MKARTSTKGFTLVEIMIVVVIIGLLAAMAIPAFQKVRTESQKKSITNNIRQLTAAADQYFLENGTTSVNVADLIGQDKYVKGNSIADLQKSGETYPTSLQQGSAYTVSWPAYTTGISFTQ